MDPDPIPTSMRPIRLSRRARRLAALMTLLAGAACGGGGALLPTEPGTDGSGGGTTPPPLDGGGGGGGGGGSGGGESQEPVTVTVTVSDDAGFDPATVTVPAGSTVIWTVTDGRHDVTFVGLSPAGGSIPETEEGASASRTFDRAGTYEYFCARHEDDGESGVVVVASGGDDSGGGEGDADPQPPTTSATVRTSGASFSPAAVTIAAGGTVLWQISGDRHNVTFTGPAPPGGNIPDTDGQTVSRTFTAAGRYDYFCTRHSGMTGAVTVQ